MQLNGSGKYITHTSSGTTQTATNSRTWTFQWTAPVAGTGTVTVYAAMNATNFSNSSAGDLIYSSSLAIPEAPATLSISNSGNTTYCQANPVTLTSNISTGNDWKLNGVTVGTNASLVASGSGTYALTNTTGACVQTASVTLTAVSGAPVVVPIVVGSQGTAICAGQNTTLTATGSGITWQPGGQTSNSITVTTAGTYSYSQSNVCGTGTSSPVSVTVTPLPSTPVVQTPDGVSFCATNSIQLNTTSSDNLLWSPGGETSASISVTNGGSYSVTASNACGSSTSSTIVVTENQLPQVPIVSPGLDQLICEGETVTLQTNSSDAIVWAPGGETTASIDVVSSGVYSVTATNECGTATSEDLSITVDALPTLPIISLNDELNLVASSNGVTYQWYLNGTLIIDAVDSVLTPTGPGIYTAEAVSFSGCISLMSEGYDMTALGMANASKPTVTVYPNPSKGQITLQSSRALTGAVELFDMTGRKIQSIPMNGSSLQNMDLNCQAGVYILRYGTYTTRLSVE
jgi:hypothetical protein